MACVVQPSGGAEEVKVSVQKKQLRKMGFAQNSSIALNILIAHNTLKEK